MWLHILELKLVHVNNSHILSQTLRGCIWNIIYWTAVWRHPTTHWHNITTKISDGILRGGIIILHAIPDPFFKAVLVKIFISSSSHTRWAPHQCGGRRRLPQGVRGWSEERPASWSHEALSLRTAVCGSSGQRQGQCPGDLFETWSWSCV